jgi:HEAT repeat protein
MCSGLEGICSRTAPSADQVNLMTSPLHARKRGTDAFTARNVFYTIAIFAFLLMSLPSPALAQARPRDVPTLESLLTDPDWTVRARSVRFLTPRASQISATGLTRLINLLSAELDGTVPHVGGETEDAEAFGEYMMSLTALVSRFNDPRAVPVLARQGVGITNGSMYRVAMAGDAGVAPLVASWNANAHLRAGVIRTMGNLRFYADSTHAPLSAASRATIKDYLLRAATATEPWVRHAFVDAVSRIGDPAYLPIVSDMSAHDTAAVDGRRYIAASAAALVPALTVRRTSTTSASLLSALQAQQSTACHVNWIPKKVICDALDVELRVVAQELAHNDSRQARNLLTLYVNELTRMRGRDITESAFVMLSGDAQYLISRL